MFLATTSIEEFWDKNQKIIFLGEWCKLFGKKNEWSGLDYEDVPFVWEDTNLVTNGLRYCNNVYEKTLLNLTKLLNEYHHINKDPHYYRIILGDWLLHYIHQLYDKYLTLRRALEKYPSVWTWLLNEQQFYTPVDFRDYHSQLINISDRYALQLYSQILTAMGYNFQRKKLSTPLKQQLSYRLNSSRRAFQHAIIANISSFISSSCYKKTVTVTSPYFFYNSRASIIRMLINSRFRCIFDEMLYRINVDFIIHTSFRKTNINIGDDGFERVLSKTLLLNMPVVFVEGFANFRKSVMKLPIHKSKVFFTANALYLNTIYKLFLAENYKTIKICITQHGSGYGIDFENLHEEYEMSVADRFYTAGWIKGTKTVPLSIPKLSKRKSRNKNRSKIILFAMNEMPRYVYRIGFCPMASNYLTYSLNEVLIFLQHFQRRDLLMIRSYPQQRYGSRFGWDTCDRIKEHYNDCTFDNLSKPFNYRLANAKIFISNLPGTTFLEALATNTPTVTFVSKKIYRFHQNAEPYIDDLNKVNILHFTPESAAEHLNAVYDDVDSWWQSEKVQETQRNFVKQYARSSPNWAQEWAEEFNRILNED